MQLTLKQIDLKSGKKLNSKNQWSLLNTTKPLMIPGSDKTRGKSLTSNFKVCGSQFLLDIHKFTKKKQQMWPQQSSKSGNAEDDWILIKSMWKTIMKAQTFSHSVGLKATSSFFCNQNNYNTNKLCFDIPLKNCKTFWNLWTGKKVAVFIFSSHKLILRSFLFSKNSCNVLSNFTYFTIKLFSDRNF